MANEFAERLNEVRAVAKRRRLDLLVLNNEFNVLSLTGVRSDNGVLVSGESLHYYTDFRYTVMARRVAPWLDTRDIWKPSDGVAGLRAAAALAGVKSPRRIGYEGGMPARKFLELRRAFPKATFVDFEREVQLPRAVKTPSEVAKIEAAVALNDEIWSAAKKEFRPGMTEVEMQRIIRGLMARRGDGEAFETIVCAGANAAECHHVPDGTVWRAGEPLLVDMGVKLDGVCSDMTRCLKPKGRYALRAEYEKVYATVLKANMAAIAAAKPGMKGCELDAVARKVIKKAGYGKAFGHSLGHGVGFEIHEAPAAAPKSDIVLKPGMLVTIEPGIYLPGKLGVRIEDLVLITETGCRVLTTSAK